jgi:hypothetical protein
MSNLYAHDTWLEKETGLSEEDRAEVLSIINDSIATGMKIAQSLEYLAVKGDYARTWDIIDEKKLRLVKRLAHFKERS